MSVCLASSLQPNESARGLLAATVRVQILTRERSTFTVILGHHHLRFAPPRCVYSMDSDSNDLPSLIRANLERKGILRELKAKLRAEVYHMLEDKSIPCPPKGDGSVFLAYELIRDFLQTFQLRNTVSVFNEESGQPQENRVDRHFIGEELGINLIDSESKDVPLLVLLVDYLLRLKKSLPADEGMAESLEVEGFQYEG